MKPDRIPDCHIIGLLKSDLVIGAISKKRQGGMYWTFNRTTNTLQKVTARSVMGRWKQPPVHLGDFQGIEEFRMTGHDENYNCMDDIPKELKSQGEN